ncbi:MAG: oxidoreductase [Candidatus Margulisiibacteriota bacterium]|nr:MAG: oxidoreductase [Candidatus Margulisbacteria bacterium GWD2_39_127]OGI04409.1 MAG: oxidoreductase [Candidatus Margulisbacteria bacterium GWF2_38_17]OGI07343.1 MAG: oxidoreductase [Candidatus Margulisbacteria bacterium GWE2_39_32]PZM80075.1 MAG: oxidoreductase [Candidatus Margulisiibacteriota bacterium]HAR62854.1 oxidoreductase [Candidatus Margulisiibacteriota bacterium]
MSKPKIAFYWCASCGGCEEAIVDLDVDILPVVGAVDIVLWPIALDFKKSDIEGFQDGEITVSFINGAVRTEEQQEMVHLLRKKSKLVVAFGACSQLGGIPGLMNFSTGKNMMDEIYKNSPIVNNTEGTIPRTKCEVDLGDNKDEKGELTLSGMFNHVYPLDQIIDVDYYLPGCAPTKNIVVGAVNAILTGNLPAKGTVLSPNKALCEECKLNSTKPDKFTIKEFKRPHLHKVDPDKCLLSQGFICMGIATRAGCGAQCISANMPCEGCFGPTDNVKDQGAKFLSAVASMIDTDDEEEIKRVIDTIDDPAGYFYRFSLASSILQGKENK